MIVYYHVESLEDGQMTSPSFLFRKRKKGRKLGYPNFLGGSNLGGNLGDNNEK